MSLTETSCIEDSIFTLINISQTFNQGYYSCLDADPFNSPASILSSTQFEKMIDELEPLITSSLFIGLIDIIPNSTIEDKTERFVWIDGSHFDFAIVPHQYPWNVNEPNDSGGMEDCVRVSHQSGHRWADIPCSSSTFMLCSRSCKAPIATTNTSLLTVSLISVAVLLVLTAGATLLWLMQSKRTSQEKDIVGIKIEIKRDKKGTPNAPSFPASQLNMPSFRFTRVFALLEERDSTKARDLKFLRENSDKKSEKDEVVSIISSRGNSFQNKLSQASNIASLTSTHSKKSQKSKPPYIPF